MIGLWVACAVLAVIVATLLIAYARLKMDIRQLSGKLSMVLKTDTNAQLTTITRDKDTASLAKNANAMLAKSRQDTIAARRTEADLKRAITNISHDLRTPLTSAKGYLQMLEGGIAKNPDATARYLTIIRGRLDTLALLMDNLFAFSNAMEKSVTLQQVNVGNVLRDALSDSYTELTNMGFTVESQIPDTPAYAQCDENALKRVLQNLIKNAYVHGRDYLRVELAGNVITITNKADGLHDIDLVSIFDRFYTADAARTHKRTGLGLAIAKELTEKMGGHINARKTEDTLTIVISLTA